MMQHAQGSVHGRFQPLHNGHLQYILAAKDRCSFLWIGVTQYNIYNLLQSPQDPHRQEGFHNPLTFYERVEMIRKATTDNGLSLSEFDIVPFPIETPAHLTDFLPTSIPIFTTIYDQWNRHKVDVLREAGYQVIVLWEESTKPIDGMTIRSLICDGGDTWKDMVPQATVDIIQRHRIRDRLISLKKGCKSDRCGL